jgi:hypothetical protein
MHVHRRLPRTRGIVLGLVAVIGGSLVVGLLRAIDGDDAGEEPSGSVEASGTENESAPTTTIPPPPADWQLVASGDGTFELSLPGSWRWLPLGNDATVDAGTAMFPDDPGLAMMADMLVDGVTPDGDFQATPAAKLVAIDGEPYELDLPDTLVIREGVDGVGLQEAYDAEKRLTTDLGATIEAEGRIPTMTGEAAWYEYTMPGRLQSLHVRRYVLVRRGAAWVVTYSSQVMPEQVIVADQIATHFTPAE